MTGPAASTRLSVVIPTHERPDFLIEALESVARQTRLPDDVVVASDIVGDAAAAEAVADVAARTGLPVRFLDGDPSEHGASSSRNRGAAAATGDLLAFLDDDDFWDPGYLEAAERRLVETDADLVATWLDRLSPRGRRFEGMALREGLRPRAVSAMNRGAVGSNVIVRREAFDAIGGYDPGLPVKNDTDFFYRFLLAGRTYTVLPERLVVLRMHKLGQLTRLDQRRIDGTYLYLEKHRDVLSKAEVRRIESGIEYIRAAGARSPGERLRYLVKALAHDPTNVRQVVRGPARALWRKWRRSLERSASRAGSS